LTPLAPLLSRRSCHCFWAPLERRPGAMENAMRTGKRALTSIGFAWSLPALGLVACSGDDSFSFRPLPDAGADATTTSDGSTGDAATMADAETDAGTDANDAASDAGDAALGHGDAGSDATVVDATPDASDAAPMDAASDTGG
jgi:hypothetical protein